jgi:hypothetical protein
LTTQIVQSQKKTETRKSSSSALLTATGGTRDASKEQRGSQSQKRKEQ